MLQQLIINLICVYDVFVLSLRLRTNNYKIVVRAEGSFLFTPSKSGGTHVVETVHYQCPPFLGRFCRAEVQFQRNAIMNNLSYQFNRHLL